MLKRESCAVSMHGGGGNTLLAWVSGKLFQNKFFAFTLAEVLITLGIIGVVAALTIPTLVSNYQQRAWDTAANTFSRKLGEALKIMNASSTLAGYNTTQEFVNELGKNIKIIKTCNSSSLKECFVAEFTTDEETYKTEELKNSKNLNENGNYGTETIGVQFADGVTALIAYNKNAQQDPFDNDTVSVSSSGKGKDFTVKFGTTALAILYDVSGSANPNKYAADDKGKYKDIRGLNISIKTGADFEYLGRVSGINCTDSNSVGYEYCNADDKTISDDNFWVGAKYACIQKGMHLPTVAEWAELDTTKIPPSYYWSATEYTMEHSVYAGFGSDFGPESKSWSGVDTLCIAD